MRLNERPNPELFSIADMRAYEFLVEHVFNGRDDGQPPPADGDGQALPADGSDAPLAAGAYRVLMRSPQHGLGLWVMGSAMMAQHGREGTWTPYEKELVSQVLSLDSGHLGLLDLHLVLATAANVPPSVTRSIKRRAEDQLQADDRELIAFIRDVAAGTLKSDQVCWMRSRLGSERGVVEYVAFILTILVHLRVMQAFDMPGMAADDVERLLADIEAGEVDPPDLDASARKRVAAGWVGQDPATAEEDWKQRVPENRHP